MEQDFYLIFYLNDEFCALPMNTDISVLLSRKAGLQNY